MDVSTRKEEQELTGKVAAVYKLSIICSKDALKKEDFIGIRNFFYGEGGTEVWEE